MKAVSKDKSGQANTTKMTWKRKVGYTDEGVSITHSKITELKIGEAPKEDEMGLEVSEAKVYIAR
jgi:hypothetical protein